jgi:hypothetical protein
MKNTKTQQPTGGITKFQINRIMQNCNYNIEMKDEWVQWVTGDNSRTSLRSITHDQAIKIMHQQTGTKPKQEDEDNWGEFDKDNRQHLTLLAYMRTAQWTTPNEKHGEVADIERLSDWLKTEKSPVRKPLKKMEPWEVSKIIEAFKGIVKSTYK